MFNDYGQMYVYVYTIFIHMREVGDSEEVVI